MNDWRFYLTGQNQPRTEVTEPGGWDTFEYTFNRSDELKSVSKVFSEFVLRFFDDGFDYINTEYDNDGTDFEIRCEVEYRNHKTNSYEPFLDSMIHGAKNPTIEPSNGLKYFDVYLVDSSEQAKYNARNEMPINPNSSEDLDGNTITPLTPDNVTIYKEDLITQAIGDASFNGGSMNYVDSPKHIPPQSADYDENSIGDNLKLDGSDTTYNNDTGGRVVIDIDINENLTQSLSGDFVINAGTTGQAFNIVLGASLQLGIYDDQGVLKPGENYNLGNSSFSQQTITTPYTKNLSFTVSPFSLKTTLQPDETIKIFMVLSMAGDVIISTESGASTSGNFDIKIVENSISDTETRSGFIYFPYPLQSKMLEAATGNGNLDADFIKRTEDGALTDGEGSLTGIGSGFMYRGFPSSKQSFSPTLKDITKSHYAVHGLGLWFNGSGWESKHISEYYQESTPYILGDATSEKIIAADDLHFNEVIAGYKNKVEFEYLNGLEEANTKTSYATTVKFIKGKLNIQSDINGSGQEIELCSRKLYKQTASEDTKWDKNYMFLVCRRDGTAIRSDAAQDFNLVENILGWEEKKNLKITPAQNLIKRHSSEISQMYWKKSGSELKFTDSQIPTDLRTQLLPTDPIIEENVNIAQADLGDPLMLPERYEIEIGVDDIKTIYDEISSNPHKIYSYTYDGSTRYGYIDSLSLNFNNNLITGTLIRAYDGRILP